jgi:hypothetical protein
MGCASGKGAGPQNIFGNKYGQSLAAVQMARERRLQARELAQRQEAQQAQDEKKRREENEASDSDEAETDDEDDFGPAPQAGIWAGSQKLQEQALDDVDGDAETDDDDDDDDDDDEQADKQPDRPVKKARADE